MSGIDIFALFVLLVMTATIVAIFVFLGLWPGKVARQRRHPQADAIAIGSWIGLIAGGVLWPLVLIWAHTQPLSRPGLIPDPSAADNLSARLKKLEQRLAVLEAGHSGKGGTV